MKTESSQVTIATEFISSRHSNKVTWKVLRYHRGGAWVCEEQEHKTTCEFYTGEIVAGVALLTATNEFKACGSRSNTPAAERLAAARYSAENPGSQEKTDYARSIGYIGTKPVIVSDGKIISHQNQDWFDFCDRLHRVSRTGLNA